MTGRSDDFDLLIVGGGLAGLLTAHFALCADPGRRICVVEKAPAIAGNQTWSFFEDDIPAASLALLDPFVRHRWPSYSVKFPKRRRQLDLGYMSGDSDSLSALVEPYIAAGRLLTRTSAPVVASDPCAVTIEGGERLTGKAVIDARGGRPDFLELGFQKFVGQVVRTTGPHSLGAPIIMDATVPQLDGYRFFYCLPFSEDTILIEDTRYTDGDALDAHSLEAEIALYARRSGWRVEAVERTEQGVLPITLASDVEMGIAQEKNAPPRIGLAGGVFNAVTGYSLPDAVRMASAIADCGAFSPETVAACIHGYRRAHGEREKYYRLLNRMLFRAAIPDQRFKVLQRFYGFGENLISRFYAGELTSYDKARILCGKPPVHIGRAIVNLTETKISEQRKFA